MDAKFKQIIEQATKLAERAIPAIEAENRLRELEPQFKEASERLGGLEKQLKASNGEFRSKVNEMADVLVTRGILDDSQKVAFVDSISNDHKELVDVVIRLSSEVKAENFGKVAELSQEAGLDPFEKMALEG